MSETKLTLVEAITQMRNAQKEYFATRSIHHLQEAKRLERIVDNMIAERANAKPLPSTEQSRVEIKMLAEKAKDYLEIKDRWLQTRSFMDRENMLNTENELKYKIGKILFT